MDEYIKREDVLKILERSLLVSEKELDKGRFRDGCIAAIQDDIGNIKYMPAADVAPKSEAENYKKLFNQLLDDFTHAMHYAGKNNNVCNFCEHDCGEGGMCKGRENRIHCHPKWRGLVNVGEDAELEKKYTEEK